MTKFMTRVIAGIAVDELQKRGTISDEEADAMNFYLSYNGNYQKIKYIHDMLTSQGRESRGRTKLVYIAEYFNEIERKIKDHIIPFVQRKGEYFTPRQL